MKIRIKNKMRMKKIKNQRKEEKRMKNRSINRRDLRQFTDLEVGQSLSISKSNNNPSSRKNLHKRKKPRTK